jgi:hypothetical protein
MTLSLPLSSPLARLNLVERTNTTRRQASFRHLRISGLPGCRQWARERDRERERENERERERERVREMMMPGKFRLHVGFRSSLIQ